MENITLEQLKTDYAALGEKIVTFEQRLKYPDEFIITGRIIKLNPGEQYAGTIFMQSDPYYDLILLPGDKDDGNWQDAMAWAKEQGGELPTRSEQSMLFANLKDEFKAGWYWSNETPASHEGSAWCQGFSSGSQSWTSKRASSIRARAVRRVPI